MNNTVNYQAVTTAQRSVSLGGRKINLGNIKSRFTISTIKVPHIVVFLFAVFLVTAITLCSLSAQIYQLNNELAALEEKYAGILTVNDELEGKIMAQCSLGEVEKYASDVLGMRKATPQDYEYVMYSAQSVNADEAPVQNSEGGFFAGIMEMLGF